MTFNACMNGHRKLTKISVDQALMKAKSHTQKGEIGEARKLLKAILSVYPKNRRAQQRLTALDQKYQNCVSNEPPQHVIDHLRVLLDQRQLSVVIEEASVLVRQYPNAFMIWNILGVAAAQSGILDRAIAAFQRVTSLRPDYADAYNNLGNALRENGQIADAIKAFQTAIELKPEYAQAYYGIGNAMMEQGEFDHAIKWYQKAIARYPKYTKAWHALGSIYFEIGELDEALIAYQMVAELQPKTEDIFSRLGTVLYKKGDLPGAIDNYKKALDLQSNNTEAICNFGNILRDQQKYSAAIKQYKRAIEIKPDFADAYNNLGVALRDQGKLDEALDSYTEAIKISPDFAEAYNNLSDILRVEDRLDEAVSALKRAIEIKPEYASAYVNLGKLYLLQQDFVKAFEYLEWRWHKRQQIIGTEFKSNKPSWDGTEGVNLFVWKEQGIGDEIMFGSLLSEINLKTNKLIVECDSRLRPLYERSLSSDIEFLDDRENAKEGSYDAQIAIGSLPKYFRRDVEDFRKASSGWLRSDTQRTAALRSKLRTENSEKLIGISWFTKALGARSTHRSIPLNILMSYLSQVPGKYVSLQYGDTTEDLSLLKNQYGLDVMRIDEIDLFHDIDGLAALISACDVVVSVDNLTVHLAGALGIDTRVLLPLVSDERWGKSDRESYWYDHLTLYRQKTQHDWRTPLEHLVRDLVEN